MRTLLKYFPNLSAFQQSQFEQLLPLYSNWNQKINVVSRQDIANLYERHVLHSLSVAKIFSFCDDTIIMDAGTGGGFPGIPLAIYFPQCRFILVDSVGKKIVVAKNIASELKLNNVETFQSRVELMKTHVDFVISRAVCDVSKMISWTSHLINKNSKNKFKNGWIFLKGGDLQNELNNYKNNTSVFELGNIFEEDFFKTKKCILICGLYGSRFRHCES